MICIEASAVSKAYGEGAERTEVLKDLNLKVEEGEFVAIVGFSGSGKTTLMSLLAGLTSPDSGAVLVNGREVTGPGADRGVVFQSYSLMPWLSVYGNVALAVDQVAKKSSRAERAEICHHYIDMVGLTHAIDRRPDELSGGMRQRVAVARALAIRPEILLLDEPLSALDALTRAKLQNELAAISKKEKKTIVLITNDVDEAILLADRVIPLTTAPNAHLGQAFPVDLPYPRDRAAMNANPNFVKLRADITRTLIEMGSARHDEESTKSAPTVVPITQLKPLPGAYKRAQKTALNKRYLEFSQLSKVYPTPKGPLTVVDGFDLQIEKGEFITLIGHSGCGKSTVLSMAAGLNEITAGGIFLDGREIAGASPDRAVVFQAPSLMPWLSAYQNVSIGVDRVYPDANATERREVVEYYLERVGLADAQDKLAADLSNGMKQRVGIARAFALSPKLLLLDEPFGMLDSLTRWELQEVLLDVWRRSKVTAICVTHDVDEAIMLADRVVMMSNGPAARIGNVMTVDLPRPRSRKALLEHPDYYELREELLDFLEAYEGGASPSPEILDAIKAKRLAKSGQQSLAATG